MCHFHTKTHLILALTFWAHVVHLVLSVRRKVRSQWAEAWEGSWDFYRSHSWCEQWQDSNLVFLSPASVLLTAAFFCQELEEAWIPYWGAALENQTSRPSSPWSLLPISLALAPSLSPPCQGLLCLSQPLARGSAFTERGAPFAFAHILLQSGHGLLSLLWLLFPRSVLVGWAGPCAWQLAGPLSCPPAAALQAVPISHWFALILFRPESDARWRQKMWATSILELSDLPVCELCLLTVSGQRKASPGGKSTIWVTKTDLEESGFLGCLLSDLCLYGLDNLGCLRQCRPWRPSIPKVPLCRWGNIAQSGVWLAHGHPALRAEQKLGSRPPDSWPSVLSTSLMAIRRSALKCLMF